MSAASRRKGVTGEREVAAIFGTAGFHYSQLQRNRGEELDGLASRGDLTLAIEAKRYGARSKWPEWWEQTVKYAPAGVPPILSTRADHGEWLVTLRLSDFVAVLR
jgi:hypothetical protein